MTFLFFLIYLNILNIKYFIMYLLLYCKYIFFPDPVNGKAELPGKAKFKGLEDKNVQHSSWFSP